MIDNKKGLNIDLTSGQYDYLYDLVMTAYELDIPEQKDWDMQTFDNLVDNVCNAKETVSYTHLTLPTIYSV